MYFIRNWIREHRAFVNYFLISCFVTIIDIVVSRICESFIDIVVANTIGVVVGFILQYILCTRKVYAGSDMRTVLIFFATWLLGLGLANLIVYVVRILMFGGREGIFYYFAGKGVSIAVPFFVLYFIRKALIRPRRDSSE